MKVKVNGKDYDFSGNSITMQELLKQAKVVNPELVSVQLNGEFVAKEKFAHLEVRDGSEVEFLYFMGGGAK